MQKIFYTLRGEKMGDYNQVSQWIHSLKSHPHDVNMIISQAYQLDQDGTVWGTVNKRLYNFAKQHKIKFMAMVTDTGFNAKKVNQFLYDQQAQAKVITRLLQISKAKNFYGIQVDFEHVPVKDQQHFTEFYQRLGKILHKNHFRISAALFPLTTDIPQTTILKRIYNGWAGFYDYKAIGKASDFVTIMTYNQHLGATTPGPIAGVPWMEKAIVHTLQYIPANKIALGIPSYSGYWQTHMNAGHGRATGVGIDYSTMLGILKKNHVHLHWDAAQKISYTFYNKNQFNEFIFAENARSFAEKLKLVKQYHLRGFAAWRLGQEDPAIWKVIDKS